MSTSRSFCPEPGGGLSRIHPHSEPTTDETTSTFTTILPYISTTIEIVFISAGYPSTQVASVEDFRSAHAVSAVDVIYNSFANKIINSDNKSPVLGYIINKTQDDNITQPPERIDNDYVRCDQDARNEPSDLICSGAVQPNKTLCMAPSSTESCSTRSAPNQSSTCTHSPAEQSIMRRYSDALLCEMATGRATSTYSSVVDGCAREATSQVHLQALSFDEREPLFPKSNMTPMAHHGNGRSMAFTERLDVKARDVLKAASCSSGRTIQNHDIIKSPPPTLLYFAVIMVRLSQ
ncbi:hypothetical protein N0V82_008401 [Gnomoniopsis sp. IMI 355080]|nr:hypothetical protein N0V82_008401 [Gnomoniopsis sp. IMI 355080]